MNFAMRLLAGGVLGWLAFAHLRANEDSLVIALASAATCLAIGNLLSRRFGV